MQIPNGVRGVALLLAVATAGCVGPGSSASVSSSAPDLPETTELRIGVLPIIDVAPIYLAIERGFFADEGLTVTPEIVQGGAAAIPALAAGDLDVAYGNWVSFLLANQEGIELRAIAAGVASAPGFTELLALPDRGLEGNPSALAGSRVAVNTLNNIGELAVRSALRAAGHDPDDVQLVEIPFPDMAAALDRGDVDAIWASEPVPTIVKTSLDAVVVVDSYVGEMEAFPVAGYQVDASWAEDHPNTIAAFRRALDRATDLIASDPTLVSELVPSYTSLAPDLAGRLALPRFESRIAADALERVAEYLVEFEMLDVGLDIDSLVVDAAS